MSYKKRGCGLPLKVSNLLGRSKREVVDCWVFLGVMVVSGLVFCRAVLSQQFAEVAACIGRMLAAFGGVPTDYIICDNMATLVKKADRLKLSQIALSR